MTSELVHRNIGQWIFGTNFLGNSGSTSLKMKSQDIQGFIQCVPASSGFSSTACSTKQHLSCAALGEYLALQVKSSAS